MLFWKAGFRAAFFDAFSQTAGIQCWNEAWNSGCLHCTDGHPERQGRANPPLPPGFSIFKDCVFLHGFS